MFEGGVDLRVVRNVKESGRDYSCGCIGAGDNEQFGFAKEFVGAVGDFASVGVFGLEEVVEHVIPNIGGLLAMLWVSVATIVIGVIYFEFAALDYASLYKAVEFLDAGWCQEVDKAVEAARYKPDPQRDKRGVYNLRQCNGKNDNDPQRGHIRGIPGR